MEVLAALSVGLLTGALLGAFGGGGGLVAAPGLALTLSLSPVEATSASLLAVLLGACAGVVRGAQTGTLRVGWAAAVGGVGLVGAAAGAVLAPGLSARATWGALAGLCVATLLVTSARVAGWSWSALPSRPLGTQRRVGPAVGAALAVGVATGLLGIGGGVFIVPVLVAFAGLGLREATATSLMVIAVTASAALAVRHHQVGVPDHVVLVPLAVGTALAVPLGWALADQLGHRDRWLLHRGLLLTVALTCAALAVAT